MAREEIPSFTHYQPAHRERLRALTETREWQGLLVRDAALRENIRANIGRLAEHPNAFFTGCAGATCVINQAALRNLRKQVAEWSQAPAQDA